jgi:hypothetical protein
MEKRLLKVAAVAVLMSVPVSSADSDDPGGWAKAKWGMTVEQVTSAFRGSKYRLVPIRAVDGPAMDGLLAIDGCVDLQIAKTAQVEPPRCFRVWFGFTKATPPTLMHIDFKTDPPSSMANTPAFIALRDMLSDKYGLPASEKKSQPPDALFFSDEVIWKFPKSRIRLSLMDLKSDSQNLFLSLQYFKAPSTDTL